MKKLKKKYYYRLSIVYLFLNAFLISCLILDIYFCIDLTKTLITAGSTDNSSALIFATIVLYLAIPFPIYGELVLIIGNIQLNPQGICIRGDLKNSREKLQYPTSVYYSDIADVSIVALQRNSKGQFVAISRPIAYLVIIDKKGKKHRFGLYSMTKRTVRKLLVDLLHMCQENNSVNFDVEKLVKDFSVARFAMEEKN